MSKQSFESWYKKLVAYCMSYEWDISGSDPEAWRDYYNDGYSPEDAANEDMSYARN